MSDANANRPAERLEIWIDATRPSAALRVFGMSLLERVLRGLVAADVRPALVRVQTRSGHDGTAPEAFGLPAELARNLPLRFDATGENATVGLQRALEQAGGAAVLALDADAIADTRLLRHLATSREAVAARSAGEGGFGTAAAAVRFQGPLPSGVEDEASLVAVADACLARGVLKPLGAGEIDDWIPRQRRHLAPYLFGLRSAAAVRPTERFLFWSTYKGSTDFFTRYVYPPLVWILLRPLTRLRVDPNVVTGFNIAITLLAIPFFAAALWIPGLIMAWTMSVLDSVDGKLAKLSFKSSELGHNLDHGLDLVHPPLWYAAWAWGLGGGGLASPLFQASLWMAAFYFVDRLVIRLFTWRTGRSIHAYTPLDVRMRTWISRRNINLPLFTIGLPLGLGNEAFVLIVAWQVATLLFHGLRLAQCWNALRRGTRALDA